MKTRQVEQSILLAKSFVIRAERLLTVQGADRTYIVPGKKSGALRRSSMELTRQLANMRKP